MKQTVLEELVQGILRVLGSSVERIILYGSVARGTDTEHSDVDIALLIRQPLSAEDEDLLSDFIVEMNLRYNKVFSVLDIDYAQFQKWERTLPFYQNVKKDGVVLWTAA